MHYLLFFLGFDNLHFCPKCLKMNFIYSCKLIAKQGKVHIFLRIFLNITKQFF